MRGKSIVFSLLAALLSAGALAKESGEALALVSVKAFPFERFRIGSDEKKFGRLEFAGGLEMTSDTRDFGAFSAFRFTGGGTQFLGVADTGFWFSGEVLRDSGGKPIGLGGFRMKPLGGEGGNEEDRKWHTDAEGMVLSGARVTVSFEREHRIASGEADSQGLDMTLKAERLPVPEYELRNNRGFETLALAPSGGPFEGARVAVTEKSLDKNGNIFAAVMEGPKKGIFFVARNGAFDITDGDFLPNGDLLLLERRFNMADGIAMRLTLIKGGDIEPGATVSGETLLEADMAYQIDNMEALDVWQDAEGATRVTLMSDDNHSILQRNLLLEFRLD